MTQLIWNNNNTVTCRDTKLPKKITGTKLAAILGLNPYTTPFACWADITHAYDFPFASNMFTDAGLAIEPKQATYVKNLFAPNLIRPSDKFGENYFHDTKGNFYTDEHFGGMWDYLDADIEGNITAVFEMKTAGAKKRALWENGNIPEYYALQAALYAYLLHVDQVYMVASFLQYKDYSNPNLYTLTTNNTIIVPFKLSERYPNFEQTHIKPAIEWWDKYIVTNTSPPYSEIDDKELIIQMKQGGPNQEDMSASILESFDTTKVEASMAQTQTNVQYVEEITTTVVDSCTHALDEIMGEIHDNIIVVDNPSIDILEKYFLELSNCLYFLSERSERLGIYDSLSKTAAQEVYNRAFLANQNVIKSDGKKPTVGENQAVAENESLYETTVNNIYNRAYKIVKGKLEAAQTMINTISKVISRRMSEASLTAVQPVKHILNE